MRSVWDARARGDNGNKEFRARTRRRAPHSFDARAAMTLCVSHSAQLRALKSFSQNYIAARILTQPRARRNRTFVFGYFAKR